MMMSRINPYIYGPQEFEEINIKSSIGRFVMNSCTVVPDKIYTKSRRKRTAAASVSGSKFIPRKPFTISLKPLDTPNAQFVNATPIDIHKMVYHVFNLTSNVNPVQVNVYPKDGESLNVFISVSNLPTPSNHTWNKTISHNTTHGSSFSEEDSTIMITKASLEKAIIAQAKDKRNTSSIFIGITFGGNYPFLTTIKLVCSLIQNIGKQLL